MFPLYPANKGNDMEIIGYLRVSTKRQGESGLGLEGQRSAVECYARQQACKITAWYTEVESGKKVDRPELARALGHAKRSRATLCVAKLDRLSRNAAFLLKLQEGKVPLVFCDYPNANELTIGIMAVVAQNEAKAISDRTKAALQEAKKDGTKLGSARPGHWEGREQARRAGGEIGRAESAKVRTQAAKEAYADLLPAMAEYKAQGLSLQKIAEKLNAEGHTTRGKKKWNPVQVARVLRRAAGIK
jgi:DNA invertase Pin-like site-specific DNA recombinase